MNHKVAHNYQKVAHKTKSSAETGSAVAPKVAPKVAHNIYIKWKKKHPKI